MRTNLLLASLLSVALGACGGSNADAPPAAEPLPAEAPPPPPPAPPSSPPPGVAETTSGQVAPPSGSEASAQPLPPLPSQAPQYAATADDQAPPPQSQWVYSYPTGQWVYTNGYGWVWVPAGTATTELDGAPYAYMYTASYGWTWYVSPWGVGPYHYGVWVSHPWHPVGWHGGGWVAHPHVVQRLGHGGGGHRR